MKPLLQKYLIILIMLCAATITRASDNDSIIHWGGSVYVNPGRALVMDNVQKKYQVNKNNFSFGAELHHADLPQDSDAFASDYGYPTLSFGVKYSINHGITMHRRPDVDAWPGLKEVDYDSHLGNTVSFYGSFTRPFFRSNRWEADYVINAGVGYSHTKYDKNKNVDNELIGARWLIYFGGRLQLSYQMTRDWGLRAGLEYWHLSNGALNRPNKGLNVVGPSIALVYQPYYKDIIHGKAPKIKEHFEKQLYLNVTAGVGAKALLEDWNYTQYDAKEGDPDYRTDHFKKYLAYTVQTDLMYRYARRWASGAGIDVCYGTYSDRVEEIDKAKGVDVPHSPWSLGASVKHQVFYHNLSLAVSLGYYFYREMGEHAKAVDKPYYEKIGIQYMIPKLGVAVGAMVKAHYSKADLTELVVSVPIRLR